MPERPESDGRDLLAELHDEQCAHGATLRRLDRAEKGRAMTDARRRRVAMTDADRIERAGGIVDIGPECFALKDGSVLSWRGQNYVPQKPTLRVRFHNWRVSRANRRDADADA